MREAKRLLHSRKLLGLLVFLLVLNLAMIRVVDRRSPAERQLYRQELLVYQNVEPGQALAELDNRLKHLNRQVELFDPECFAAPSEAEVQKIYRELGALSAIRDQVMHLIDYPAYLDTLHANAAQMGALSIFSQESSFSRRNIAKTDRDFPKSVSLSLDHDAALTAFASDKLCGTGILAFLMLAVLELMEERKQGLWSLIHGTSGGRSRLALHRAGILLVLSMGATAVLFGGKLLGLGLYYGGLGDLSRHIQSLAVFRDVPWVISLRQFLICFFLMYALGAWLVSLILWAILQAVHHLPLAIAAMSAFLAAEYGAFHLIPDSYAIVFLRYANLFALVDMLTVALHYLNLNLFGIPVQGFLLTLGMIPPLTAGMVLVNLALAERKKPISPQNSILIFLDRLRTPFSKLVGRLGLFGFELFKLLWLQKGICILLALGIGSFALLGTSPADSELYNTQIAGLAASMQGPITGDTLAQIEEKIAIYETWDEAEAVTNQLMLLHQLRDKVSESLAAGDGVWLMNQAGASALLNQNNVEHYPRNLALLLLLTVCLLLPGSFAAERQNRMYTLLRGVPLGRGVLWRKKVGSAFLLAVLAYGIFEAGELYRLYSAYGQFPIHAPIQSIDYFAPSSLPLSIGGGLVVFLLLRLIAFLLAATVALLISQLSRRTNHALLLSTAVLLLPAGLQYIGIAELPALSRLFSPMECTLRQYALAAACIPAILCIHYRLWLLYRSPTE